MSNTVRGLPRTSAVVGPLVEVPVLVTLVYVSLWARRFFFAPDGRVKRLELATG